MSWRAGVRPSRPAGGSPPLPPDPSRGTWTTSNGFVARVGVCSSARSRSHNATSASAARCSYVSHGWPVGGRIRSVSWWMVASNWAPITSGNSPRTCNMAWSGVHHIRTDRASRRARPSSTVGFVFVAGQAGQIHRRDLRCPPRPLRIAWTRRPTARPTRAARRSDAPACAAAATAGNDSSARAVSTASRTLRSDTPSRPASVGSIPPRSSSTRIAASSSTRKRRCSRASSSRSRDHPRRRPSPQLVEMIRDVEHATIQTRGYDSYPPAPRRMSP